ncbi:Allantoinase [uncultured archaeon]|nr:Allantoinase [uncultured archaeon]
MALALNNGKAFINGRLEAANILISNGKIEKISETPFGTRAEKEIDCRGKIILPGAIDCHVHFRCPGFEYKEDWVSGSLAALHGGATTVMDMPNTRPPTLTVKDFGEKTALAKKSAAVNFSLFMGFDGGNLQEISACQGLRAVKVYYGASTNSNAMDSPESLEKLFTLAMQKNLVVVLHAEDEAEIKKNEEKFRAEKEPAVHTKIRNDAAETNAIRVLVCLQEKIGNKLHFAHISSKKGLELIKKAKKGQFGRAITCEATPNHLFLDSKAYKKMGNLVKCNPSIKSSADRKALWEGLIAGDIDSVASDHAPHTLEEKKKGYWEAPSGIPGIETMLPLLIDAALRNKIAMQRVVEASSERPAEIFGWASKGFIREGFDADLVIVDPKRKFTVENARLFTKAGYSPFNGWKLKGFVEKTLVGGAVYG